MGPLKKMLNPLGLICLATLSGCTDPATANDPVELRGEEVHGEEVHTESVPIQAPGPETGLGEHLLAQAPDGWKQGFSTKTPALRIAEFIPRDDRIEDWQEKVTFESLSGDPLPDPIDFVTGIGKDQSATCERFDHLNIRSGLENNYPTSVRLLTCSHNKITKRGHVMLIKAIQANDHFYVITRAKRIPPVAEGAQPISEAEMAAWAAYMRGITVCDSDREEHPCVGAVSDREDSATESPPTWNNEDSAMESPPT